jgi:tRNA-2-methylthio-N6-dimethylallyladenosine synthase
VATFRRDRKPLVATELSADFVIPPFLPNLAEGPAHKRFITIMQGCDNFCTYCVVPYTRGREISRSFTDILAEATHLVSQGVKEITLIGQNVNSYGQKSCNPSQRQGFPELLRAVAGIAGLERLRFTSSHPKDLSEELMRCFAEIPVLCPHFHLPVQSGSNSILKQMNRKYTIEAYLDKATRLREYRPDIALTTDIIVGFPGETEEDFVATMQVIETVQYHGSYSFKYSDRPNAKAADFPDKVAEEVKTERLARLQARQEEIALALKQAEIGKTLEVMVEGASKSPANQWSGRTGGNQIVNFSCEAELVPGQLLMVEIESACQNSLRGKMI